MGLFSKKEECDICHNGVEFKKLSDGCICKECISKCNLFINPLSWKSISSEKVIVAVNAQQKNVDLLKIFSPTKKVDSHLEVDENNHLWKLNYMNVIFHYSEIISYELLEDGESITKGSLGSALVGGALFGGVGALVGSAVGTRKTNREITEFKIKITTKNPLLPDVYINLLPTGKVKSSSFLYKSYCNAAQNILAVLAVMVDVSSPKASSVSSADEIMKFKQLLDNDVISEEEFEFKKKQLLGL